MKFKWICFKHWLSGQLYVLRNGLFQSKYKLHARICVLDVQNSMLKEQLKSLMKHLGYRMCMNTTKNPDNTHTFHGVKVEKIPIEDSTTKTDGE